MKTFKVFFWTTIFWLFIFLALVGYVRIFNTEIVTVIFPNADVDNTSTNQSESIKKINNKLDTLQESITSQLSQLTNLLDNTTNWKKETDEKQDNNKWNSVDVEEYIDASTDSDTGDEDNDAATNPTIKTWNEIAEEDMPNQDTPDDNMSDEEASENGNYTTWDNN